MSPEKSPRLMNGHEIGSLSESDRLAIWLSFVFWYGFGMALQCSCSKDTPPQGTDAYECQPDREPSKHTPPKGADAHKCQPIREPVCSDLKKTLVI